MFELMMNGVAVIALWLAVEYCFKRQTAQSLEDASLIPFADDPEVARRVEMATGLKVKAVAPEEAKPGWINLDI
ncbi:cbb3-type cytochrome c oxidase subunit 3 [Pseudomonas sp. p50]|uniref:cbb3-type cytochrome c oxidase subunit 3 n=1 Tax=Pseudomonas sp. p50(2008) TaxID=2816832 RepID=UPI00188C1C54|nr:cbb3-type cytochrome c oxidase subunit 3 [Pseudomonas sp. p50(2008)]MBF4559495.1 cbb3-type cytochrome c oxidase subunit 3 [Pseudomonas sp. p50(2008)]MBH2035637.1 cbb3-type cytochrome c oxidase subunit 3 [Pseudomonadales bacterium]MBH2074618.1 cbb3-type cytochrome c oxidase subunit 3 [Pseudomonadales bacterium]